MGPKNRPHIHQKSASGALLALTGYFLNLGLALTAASKATILTGKALQVPPGSTLPFVVAGILLFGGTAYWLLSRVRAWPLRHHRNGWRLMGEERCLDAIPEFEASYAWFSRHRWLDHMRALLLLDSSGISTRESALLNIAHCHDLLEDPASAEAAYQRVLKQFPESRAARLSLHWRERLSGNPSDAETPDDKGLSTMQCSDSMRVGIGVLVGVPLGLSIVDAVNSPSHRLAWSVVWGLFLLCYVVAYSVLLKPFRQGVHHLRSGRYPEAIAAFEAQEELLARHPWVDRFRAVVFLWASSMSLKETVQINIALCYVRMGERERAEAGYRKVLEAFPGNVMARDALRLFRNMSD